jgi:hypothetical protein
MILLTHYQPRGSAADPNAIHRDLANAYGLRDLIARGLGAPMLIVADGAPD